MEEDRESDNAKKLKIKQKLNILSFPNEILVKIVSYVCTQDLLLNVTLVSKKFYDIMKNCHPHISVT